MTEPSMKEKAEDIVSCMARSTLKVMHWGEKKELSKRIEQALLEAEKKGREDFEIMRSIAIEINCCDGSLPHDSDLCEVFARKDIDKKFTRRKEKRE